MLDFFTILTKGGLVLWWYQDQLVQHLAEDFAKRINDLIHSAMLEGSPTFNQGFLGYVTVTLRKRFLDHNVAESMKSTLRNQFFRSKINEKHDFREILAYLAAKNIAKLRFLSIKVDP